MPRTNSAARVKPGFRASEARDIVRMQREANIGRSKTTQVLARKFRRDPAYLEARKWVWQKRMEGLSTQAIAELSEEQFGERITWPRVEAMVESATDESTEPEAARLRHLEGARMDWYLECLAPQIRAGNDKAINTAVRISERRARMYGLDKPVQAHVHITGTVDPELQDLIAQARDEQREDIIRRAGIEDAEVVEEADGEDGYIDMVLPDEEEL